MTFPALILGIIISTLYGALFHLWRGGGPGRLLLFLVLGWLGFWLGQAIGNSLHWRIGNLGPLNILPSTALSIIFLMVGHWLSLAEVRRR